MNVVTVQLSNVLQSQESQHVYICDLLLQTREQVVGTSVSFYMYSSWNQYDQ